MFNQDAKAITSQILAEDMISLTNAQNELEPIIGKKLDKTTLYRWCVKGVGGVKLEHVRLGNQIMTSRQAMQRFIVARTEACSK